MAVQSGSKMLQSDLTNWYNTFNTFISKHGGGAISTLAVPSGKIMASHINNLNSKITEFKNDEFLKTQANWWVSGTNVTAGTKFQPSEVTYVTTTMNNMSQVKCRNTYTYANGYHGNGTETNGNHGNGTCDNGGNSRGRHTYNNRTNSQCCCNSYKGNGSHSNEPCGHGTKSNVNYNHQTAIDITCSRTA